MKLSARNALKGKVKEIKAGAVNTEVIVELKGGEEIVSMISKDYRRETGPRRRARKSMPSSRLPA